MSGDALKRRARREPGAAPYSASVKTHDRPLFRAATRLAFFAYGNHGRLGCYCAEAKIQFFYPGKVRETRRGYIRRKETLIWGSTPLSRRSPSDRLVLLQLAF
jgi:hypothetical protein